MYKLALIAVILMTAACQPSERKQQLLAMGIDCNGKDFGTPQCVPPRNPNNHY